jgi:hypothetical protein
MTQGCSRANKMRPRRSKSLGYCLAAILAAIAFALSSCSGNSNERPPSMGNGGALCTPNSMRIQPVLLRSIRKQFRHRSPSAIQVAQLDPPVPHSGSQQRRLFCRLRDSRPGLAQSERRLFGRATTQHRHRYVFKIPSDGLLRTSSAEQYGWAKDHYYYYSAQGVRALPDSGPAGLIWGKINGEESGASGKRKYEEFFVGAAQKFKDQVN